MKMQPVIVKIWDGELDLSRPEDRVAMEIILAFSKWYANYDPKKLPETGDNQCQT